MPSAGLGVLQSIISQILAPGLNSVPSSLTNQPAPLHVNDPADFTFDPTIWYLIVDAMWMERQGGKQGSHRVDCGLGNNPFSTFFDDTKFRLFCHLIWTKYINIDKFFFFFWLQK